MRRLLVSFVVVLCALVVWGADAAEPSSWSLFYYLAIDNEH